MKALKYLICTLLISIGFNSCEQLNHSSPDENIDWSEIDYAYIDMENYPEWDTGLITVDNTFLLFKEDTLSNGYVGYLNNSDIKSKGIAFYFDENTNLTSFITNYGCCYISWKSSNKADIQIMTESSNDFYEDIILEAPQIMSTRAIFIPVILGLARAASIAMTINSAVQGTKALLDGDLETAGKNALGLICGGVGGKVFKHALDDLAIDTAFAGFEKLDEKLTQTYQSKFIGNCHVSMNAKKTSINTYRLSVTISNYETISTTETKYLLCGVAVRKWPYVTYLKSESKTGEFIVDGNGTTTIDFELPENCGYHAAPYLLPVVKGTPFIKDCIRHGNIVKLDFFDGFIDEFKQLSFTENNGKYTFKCNANAICNTINNQYWKLYYENKTGWKEFFEAKTYNEPSLSAPNTGEFDFEIELSTGLFDDEIENIKLGIAIFNSSHQMLIASEPQTFKLTTDDRWVDLGLPSGILWAAYNVGASSPEEYGGYYAWGETEEKSIYTWEYYKYGKKNYYDGDWYWTGSFIGDDISGTSYDAAHVKWGDGARMPRQKDIQELIHNCTWILGSSGAIVIGPNGNKIFLPFSGRCYPDGINNRTFFGYYWSGTCVEGVDGDVFGYTLYCGNEERFNYEADFNFHLNYGQNIRPVKDKETGAKTNN